MDARHNNIKKAHAKTCKWILKRPEYIDWLNSNKVDEHHGFLWIKGKPGAGKSTLMKFILSNARRRMKDKIIISFFFNARGEQLEKSTTGMYRSLLLQLLQELPRLHSVLDPGLILGIGENHDWSVEALRTLFEQTVEGLGDSSVVVFIDALDECDESEIRSMVSSFKSLGNLSAAEGISFQVCLASRHYPHITMAKKIELVLEGQEGHEQDIISFLDSELEIGDSKLAQEVRSQIKEKASGVFMWVVLVSGILQQKYDQGHIHALKQALREIPGDLHELFRDIITRDDTNKDELLLCIQWVLFARHPLKPEQLYFAIRSYIECAACKWDRDEIPEDAIGNFILSSSKGLAEVTRVKKDPTVQFIHESVRDFLLKDNGLRAILLEVSGNLSAESHDQLKKCCLEYTQFYITEHGALGNDSKEQPVIACGAADDEFPFLRYAVQNVLYHANAAEEGDLSQTSFLETFPLGEWIQYNNVFQDKEVRRHNHQTSLLYLLAEYNFGSLIEGHKGSQSCFDIENERYGAPILAAMATGSRPTVLKLLTRETHDEPATSRLRSLCNEYKVQQKGKSGLRRDFKYNPKWGLLYYILQDDDLIVAAFAITSSKACTNIDFRTHRGGTPFSLAIRHGGHNVTATVGFLLENGADIESRDQLGRTPLCLAAANGNTAVVAFLLDKGASVEHHCNRGQTPLSYASIEGNEECMRLLISRGANLATTDNQGQTALFKAAVDVKAIDNSGFTALAWSLKKGTATEAMVQILLNHGDKIDRVDLLGRTLLMIALNSNLSIMKQLVDMGAGIDWVDNRGQSALLLAVKLKAESQARLLIDSGACTDVFDTLNNRTALSYAVTSQYCDKYHTPLGHPVMELFYRGDNLPPSIAEALLSRGAVVDASDMNGRTPLSYAASVSDNADFVSLLLYHGADVHRADNSGRTPLSHAAGLGAKACQLLLDHGADVNAADNRGRTPLSYAASSRAYRAENCVQLLLDRGAIPDIVDGIGNNALSYAATDTVRALLSISL
ncbi:Ankyrin repeat [Fusarium oxysporum f. sp. vasinfectum]|nr:Ankyrin repeat [Fusarium oxysporum f. sp. vasinfectum]